ncbi:MAG: 50S ribosomal protein L18 [Candidatus Dadabacteria bacterium]
MTTRLSRKIKKDIRHTRVRRKISGSPEKPRLSVFKSSSHIYGQIIDDLNSVTIVSASSLTPEIRDALGKEKIKKTDAAKVVGKALAEKAVAKGITKVSFDRGGYPYHGRIKAFADAAREAGLEF